MAASVCCVFPCGSITGKGGNNKLSKEEGRPMRWRYGSWILVTMASAMRYSSELERISYFVSQPGGNETVLLPFIFKGYDIIMLPTTEYSDMKKSGKYAEEFRIFFGNLPSMVWDFVIGDMMYKDDDRFRRMFDKRMGGYLSWVSLDILRIYINRSRTFSDALKMVYERVLQCSEGENRQMERYGECVIKMIDEMMENMPGDMDEGKRKELKSSLDDKKEHAESFYDTTKWRRIVEAEEIVCNACKEICLDLREEEMMGLLAEGYAKKAIKEDLDEYEFRNAMYLEHATVNRQTLLDAHRKHGKEVTKEVVKQMLLGKKGEEIDKRYIDKVADIVREKRRVRERMIEKSMRELLRDEEKTKSKKKGKKKKKRKGVSETKEEEKKEGETEEVEKSEEAETSSVEVGGGCKKKSKGGRKRFKIHRRVLRWRKSPEKIKEKLDRGKEEKWKGRSLEEIKEQKMLHDIVGVVSLLKSPDANKFFMDAGEHTKGGSSRGRMVAIGVLECGGRKVSGVVEVGTFRDPGGCQVVYHLMFRPTDLEELGGVMSPEFVKANDIEKIDEDKEYQDESKFVYPPGVTFETVKAADVFQVVWRNPSDTSEILRRLTIHRRPCVI
ncbi:DUF1609 domain-containing protein [Encephalitozoon cuniculi]|nr:DUF1609 domain-containing protein [Encephalitozoon cuniculi]UYI27765.1 DUF1609 domain-containing protein [Encephalitozoon cuniculi]